MNKRESGILLHITSLPSPYGIGDLGSGAYAFADFLAEAKQSLWQVLPLNPTNQACGNSPYSISSAFAGNTNLISPELLVIDGLLSEDDLASKPEFPQDRCDYSAAIAYKEKLLLSAYKNFGRNKKIKTGFNDFCLKNDHWLRGFALFDVMKKRFRQQSWNNWDEKLRLCEPKTLKAVEKEAEKEIERTKFLQFLFFKQWSALKEYCNKKGIRIIGDMPIYVDYDSADVWIHNDVFKLDKKKAPTYVAGVPPDYFSQTGQLWGNPVYKWDAIEKSGFQWWISRMGHNLTLFDIVRIDHFRGLVAYWEIPAGEETAVKGKWVKVPAKNLFNAIIKRFGTFRIIAEDLGHITPDVRQVLRHFKFPGMKVLLFAFCNDERMHPYLPHTYEKNWVVYTGTHDNNTARGWFENEASHDEKKRLFRYLGQEISAEEASREFVRLAMMSVADTAIIPLQDILGLDEAARMNVPSTPRGNWEWRYLPEQLTQETAQKLREITEIYGRTVL